MRKMGRNSIYIYIYIYIGRDSYSYKEIYRYIVYIHLAETHIPTGESSNRIGFESKLRWG